MEKKMENEMDTGVWGLDSGLGFGIQGSWLSAQSSG